MIPAAVFFFKLIFSNACSLKDSQKFFVQYLSLFTLCLLSMFLNNDIVDIEKADGVCLLAFAVDNFSGLFLHSGIFSIIHLRSA